MYNYVYSTFIIWFIYKSIIYLTIILRNTKHLTSYIIIIITITCVTCVQQNQGKNIISTHQDSCNDSFNISCLKIKPFVIIYIRTYTRIWIFNFLTWIKLSNLSICMQVSQYRTTLYCFVSIQSFIPSFVSVYDLDLLTHYPPQAIGKMISL